MYKRYTQDSLKNYIQRIQANERDSMPCTMEPITLRPKTVDHSHGNLKKEVFNCISETAKSSKSDNPTPSTISTSNIKGLNFKQ